MLNKTIALLTSAITVLSQATCYELPADKTTEYFSTVSEYKNEKVSIVFAGDNLIHKPVIKAGIKEDGTRDYDYMYNHVSDYIKSFDIRIINQETPLITDESKFSGYPRFGSPVEIGDAVIDAGFNMVAQATNHTIDQDVSGVCDSFNFWMAHDIPVIGIHLHENESDIWYMEENGIRIAFVNYTYGLNGLQLPKGHEYRVDTFDNKDEIKATLAEAEESADATVVVAHWGNEYVYEPTAWQRDMADFLIDNGADVIFGAHPHVIEPVEIVNGVPVFWSVGNFISGQSEVPRMLGMLAEVTLERKPDGTVKVVDVNATPTVTHISTYSERFEVYLLKDYTEELCANHRLRRTRGAEMSVQTLSDLWTLVVEDNIKEVTP